LIIDQLPTMDILGPIMITIGLIYVLGPMLPLQQSWARYVVFIVVWVIVGRYFVWRLFETSCWQMAASWRKPGFGFACGRACAACDALILYIASCAHRQTKGSRPS